MSKDGIAAREIDDSVDVALERRAVDTVGRE